MIMTRTIDLRATRGEVLTNGSCHYVESSGAHEDYIMH